MSDKNSLFEVVRRRVKTKVNIYAKQLRAAYVLDCVREFWTNKDFVRTSRWQPSEALLAARFDVLGTEGLQEEQKNSLLAVAENIVSRGNLVPAPYDTEKFFGFKKGLYSLHETYNGRLDYQLAPHCQLTAVNVAGALDLFKEDVEKAAAYCVRAPLAIARIEKFFLHLLNCGVLSLEQNRWSLTLVTSDETELYLQGLRELQILLKALFCIAGQELQLPELQMTVITVTKEYEEEKRSFWTLKGGIVSEEAAPAAAEVDLVLEIHLFRTKAKFGLEALLQLVPQAKRYFGAFSATTLQPLKGLISGGKLTYPPFMSYEKQHNQYVISAPRVVQALTYLLQSIFRIVSFREKQLDVLNLALGQQNVIALLPTGAGKSLIFQLAAFLQPGVTLVVEPLKALMKDQLQNLKGLGIDRAVFISSDIVGRPRQTILENFVAGQYQFLYLSPERLQIDDFRKTLQSAFEQNVRIQYGVIDEAHCVSEWGHDFRTSYLNLGSNLRKFLGDKRPVTLLALTGTASYDVLADIQRELNIKKQLHVITPANFKRQELHFIIRSMTFVENEEEKLNARIRLLNQTLEEIPRLLGKNCSFETYMRESNEKRAGIIFCPHASGAKGVNDSKVLSSKTTIGIFSRFAQSRQQFKRYLGKYTGQERSIDNERNQDAFKKDDIAVLVATKAFGMGVDKPNIRFTVHTYLPGSIEAFYQEAGRAGRDRRPAICAILFEKGREGERSHDAQIQNYFFSLAYPSKAADYVKCLSLLHLETSNTADKGAADSSIEKLLKGLSEEQETCLKVLPLQNNASVAFAQELLENIELNRGQEIPSKEEFILEIGEELAKLYAKVQNRSGAREELFVRSAKEYLKRQELKPRLQAEYDEGQLLGVYNKTFTEQDTLKAVYRLGVLGVFKDYGIDYRAGTITLNLQRLPSLLYAKRLREYLSRYESRTYINTLHIKERVGTQSTIIALENALKILIDFTYDKIAKKREAQIEVMFRSIVNGLKKSGGRQNAAAENAFEAEIYNYFAAKYAEEMREDICLARLRFGMIEEWVERRIKEDRSGAYQDNLSHLRGSCNRLLGEYPNNPILYLLRAYTSFLNRALEQKQSEEDYRRGWQLLQEQLNGSERMMENYQRRYEALLLENCHDENRGLLQEQLEKISLTEIDK